LAVIPVYNHATTLGDVVRRTLALIPEVLVVDDGSTDDGIRVLSGLNIITIRHPENRGKGAAILTAAGEARRLGMTHMITLDADGQHDPADVVLLIDAIQTNPEAIIVGNRRFSGSGAPRSSRFGKHFSNFWFRVQTGLKVKDTQCGFRAYPIVVFEALALREKHYSFEVEVLVKAAWAGLPIKDVDVSVHYPIKKNRISHFRPFLDNLRISLLNTRLTLRSLIPWPHRQILEKDDPNARITLLHPIRSLRFLLRQELTPCKAAASGAVGVFLGTLPAIGFHTLLILVAAGYFRLNRVAALAASRLCMPPLVPALCIEIGYYLRHGHFLTEISIETLGYQGLLRLLEWGIGSIFLAPVLSAGIGAIIYFVALGISKSFYER